MTTDTEQQQTFAIGERVVLHDISSRPELNGAAATVLDWHEESKRFAVQLDGGEAIKIKPSRLARPQAEAQVEPSQPPAAAQTKRHTDPSIFVNADGQFFQPLAPLAAPVLPRIHDAPTDVLRDAEGHDAPTDVSRDAEGNLTNRFRLPAGNWEVRFVEQMPSSVAVTLVAVVKTAAKGEDEALTTAWNELRGLTCTRTVHLEEHGPLLSPHVAATVEDGGILQVTVPPVPASDELDATGMTFTLDELAEVLGVDDIEVPMKKNGAFGPPASTEFPDKENLFAAQPGVAF